MKIEYNNGKKTLRFEHYKVIEKADNYFAIYDNNNNLISHKDKWRKATKLASMLDSAYKKGYLKGLEW